MKTASKGVPAIFLAGSLLGTGVAGAAASVPSEAERAADELQHSQILDDASREEVNEDLETSGQETLEEDAYALGFNTSGDAIIVLDDGSEVLLASSEAMEEELASASEEEASSADRSGALTGLAATIAGCGGGVIGYDAILSILEKRVSYWALVKFLGSKIGPGLAISCVAGAGGALATYMGW